ncbi:MAG: hypothetical protein EZS26_000557 [Candidatus Ordinivivax streblomastigis]|uniref:Uncharacterized protein n=1 Tax=Candidatus Ordinivivax streblomastigis TaxID=2540710 RepID=A0A5M8P4V6_9BACT|nr:MAG: hypothetical protein EZS26_000410 [Candidatus Ordinivivax streblomastigis]KAA6303397.1 MAG: hypothetical protein EZS26_000557 [Candidatus Ordinivivax streblomastigis]
MAQAMNIKEIKQLYPDEWILLGNPVWDDYHLNVLSGVPLYHSADKREVYYLGKPLIAGYDKITIIYAGLFKPSKRSSIGILKRVSS